VIQSSRIRSLVYRLTDYQTAIELQRGIVYKASRGHAGTARRQESDLSDTQREVKGFLSLDSIPADVMHSGVLIDGSVIEYVVDPKVAFMAPLQVNHYTIRTINYDAGVWSLDMVSSLELLSSSMGDVWSRTCRVSVFSQGTNKCRVDPSIYIFNAEILVLHSQNMMDMVAAGTPSAWETAGYGNGGAFSVNTGPNAGWRTEIKEHTRTQLGPSTYTTRITLQESCPYPLTIGTYVTLLPGCDKRFDGDCLHKYNNQSNFQGEPTMPREDIVRAGLNLTRFT
jgi:uncharacterized phage protein (TIGR02218 family)